MTDDRIADGPEGPSGTGGDGPDGAEEVDGGEPTPDVSDAVGDGRQKYVEVVTAAGDCHEHGDSYLRQTEGTIFVSTDPGFSPEDTVTYRKRELSRVTIEQHHSTCFITTAVTGEERTLAALRRFRDDSMAHSHVGRPLVGLYERVSPPIAGTLAERPDGATARVVRPLIRSCARLARRRESASTPGRAALSALLVALYVAGVVVAAAGHVAATLGVGEPNG